MADSTSTLRAARASAETQDGVLTRRQIDELGVSEASLRLLVASGVWSPLLRGTYLLEPYRPRRMLQRSWARSAVLLVPGSHPSHHTAAVLLGLRGVPRSGVVHVTRPTKAERRPRLWPHRCAVPDADVIDLDGLLVTSVERTLSDLVPLLDPLQSLSVLDSALNRELTTASGIAAAQERARGHRGYRTTAHVWSIADGRAASPLESRTRYRCLDVGLVPLGLQHQVLDARGRLIAVADLSFDRTAPADPEALPLLAEADGRRYHPDGADVDEDDDEAAAAFVWDRRKQNAVIALGHPVVRVTWEDTMSRLAVPTSVRALLPPRAA